MKLTNFLPRIAAVFALAMMVAAPYASAAVLDTDTFDTGQDGWGGSGESWDSAGQRLAINRDQTATKTFNFGAGYANQTVTVTLDAAKTANWESDDRIQITANGTTVYNSNTDGSLSFDATLNAGGQLSLVVTPNTNNNNEDMYIDNVVINYTPPVNHDPVLSPASMSATIADGTPNGTSVMDVNATDSDGDTLSYAITAGNTDNTFAINASTGIITVADSANLNHTVTPAYALTVTASDGRGGVATGTVDITLRAIKIGWEQVVYQTSEDTTIAYGLSTPMAMRIVLENPVSYPVSVAYLTHNGSAIGDIDYRIAGGTVTIPALQDSAVVVMDIYHDEPIELDENFTVVLSSPVSATLDPARTTATVTILAQTTAPLCFSDDFNAVSLDGTWRTLYSSGTFIPQINNNRLRLTPDTNLIATAVTKDFEFDSSENLIIVEFTHYAYDGGGADGMALVLYDTVVGANPDPGAFGGSLGYAQKCSNNEYYAPYGALCSSRGFSDCSTPGGCPGFEGGWLGLGIDEYGNYKNPTEGRIGGTSFTANAISIRGDGSGIDGYEFLAGTTAVSPALWDFRSAPPRPGDKFKMTVDARHPAHLYIRLERDTGSGYQTIINQFDAKDPVYNQSETPDFVRLALTASTGAVNAIHEIDDITVWGRCTPYNPIPPTPPGNVGAVDVVDDYPTNGYAPRTGLKTKIASKTDSSHVLDAVWLGTSGGTTAIPYYDAGNNDVVDMPVLFYVSDINATDDNGSCTTERYQLTGFNGSPLVATFSAGDTYARTTSTYTVQAQAHQRSKIVPKYINFYGMNLLDPSITCLVNSSNSGNIEGMPQCVNSENQYLQAFGQAAVDRCRGILNGAPCLPSNHGIGTGEYAHDYGCYQCTLDALGSKGCSSDAFAIRPDRFQITSTSPHWPDLLTAAEDYNATLQALSFAGSLTNDYNVTDARNVLELNTSARYYPDNTLDTTNALIGVFSMGADDFNMSNGISVKSGTGSNEVMGVRFSDVGKMTLQVTDKIWSQIDDDDTALSCEGTYICGDTNTTFIPYDFNISSLSVTNNNGNPGTFTYLGRQGDTDAILRAMSGRFDANISAQNKDGFITRNFRQGAWENTVTVTPSVVDTLHGDANETVITNLAVGFGTGSDANGTKHFVWNDTNTSLMLRFNFNMSPRIPVDPFRVDGNETNMTIVSHYTGSAPAGSRDVNGSRIENADQNVTFVYGRLLPRDVRVFGSVPFSANAWYEVYNSPTIESTPLPPSRNEAQWFINTLHNDTMDGDGNVTVIVPASGSSLPATSVYGSGTETYGFSPFSMGGYKAHIETMPWLWYGTNALQYADPVAGATAADCLTHPCFNINVVPATGATGSAKEGSAEEKGSKKSDSGEDEWKSTSDYAPAVR